jgi:hypothetical protein
MKVLGMCFEERGAPAHSPGPAFPESALLIHSVNPKVGDVRNQDIDLLDSQ